MNGAGAQVNPVANPEARPPALEPAGTPSFSFVRMLAEELSEGQVDIPSFPDVAMRLQRVLADVNSTPDRIVRVIGSEPTLAARILNIANSAALNPSGSPVTGLPTAVSRMGFDMLRATAVSFAMAQLRRAPEFRGLERSLSELWNESIVLAAYAQVLARRQTPLQPDSAMLSGLLHGIGKLYILTRASRHPELFADRENLDQILRDWHAAIARAVLENWCMPGDIVDAVHQFQDGTRDPRGWVSLTDVLGVAHLFMTLEESPARLAVALSASRSANRLQIDQGPSEPVIEEAQAELRALRSALGD